MRATGGADLCLAGELAGPVGIERGGGGIRAPGTAAGTIENVVCREMDERNALRRADPRHRPGRGCVHAMRERGVAFGPVHIGERCGVDDGVGAMVPNGVRDRGGIRKLDIVAAKPDRARIEPPDFACHLPGPAKNEELHITLPSRTPTPLRSRRAPSHPVLARNQSTVRASPSSIVTSGRQPTSARIRVGSIA